MAILSSRPIHSILNRTGPPFHHGLLEVAVRFDQQRCDHQEPSACAGLARAEESRNLQDVGGCGRMDTVIHILLTHLTPRDARARALECQYLAQRCATLTEGNTPAILLGDLNTLSPLDDAHYAAAKLEQTLAKDARLRTKFLRTADDSSVAAAGSTGQHAARLDYRPMEVLLSAGMHDMSVKPVALQDSSAALHDRDGERADRTADFHATVGMTNVQDDSMHAAAMRLDYILGNRAVRAALREDSRPARAVRDEDTMEMSDHLPVLLRLFLR